MCRPLSQGGRRCSAYTATALSRKNILRRIDRNSSNGNTDLVARDAATLAGFDQGRAHYGDIVTTMDMSLPLSVEKVFEQLRAEDYRPLVVGGSVRDALEGSSPKDIDIEVYGATIDQVSSALRRNYRVDEVGKAFGVLKVTLPDGTDLDVSVPRRDNQTGAGHRGFTVETDLTMSAEEAAARRDYTINALGYDSQFKVCVDPYHGREDLEKKQLRHVSEAFAEDPLRVLRGFQFASRFDMDMHPETAQMCQRLAPRASELPVERVRGEFGKFYSKGKHPARGMRVLAQTGWDATIPGLAAVNTENTQKELEQAHQVALEDNLGAEDRTRLMAAVLARKMEESKTRPFVNHTIEGGDLQREALGLSKAKAPESASATSMRVWARELGKNRTSVRQWSRLERATGSSKKAEQLLKKAEALGCADGAQPDLLMGRHILERFPERAPGPWMGQLLSRARTAQEQGVFKDDIAATKWLDAQF